MKRALGLAFAAVMPAAIACHRDGLAPPSQLPSKIELVVEPSDTATVGSPAGSIRVKVTNAAGAAVRGAVVTFTVVRGSGRVAPTADTTGLDGTTGTSFTVGTTAGFSEISAVVSGVAPARVLVVGVAGPTRRVALAPLTLRFSTQQNDAVVGATARDEFGNPTFAPITWAIRDSTLVGVSVTPGGSATIGVRRRPGQTYVVAQAGGSADSVRVLVEDASSGPCAFVTRTDTLPLGGTVSLDAGTSCVHANSAGAEYAVVAHYNTAVSGIAGRVLVTGFGIVEATSAFPSPAIAASVAPRPPRRDLAFELALRDRESREIGDRVAGARAWFDARSAASPNVTGAERGGAALRATMREGDVVSINVNAFEFCTDPDLRLARVAALTNGTIVLADVANPEGGFTDAEYRAFAALVDTLVVPVDTAAFGAPADVDGDRRIAILFTRAVNELSQPGSNSVVLGFYFVRDLLPKTSPFGDCPGSNVSELVYVMVPDPTGAINSNRRTKGYVDSLAISVIGHEYQHLINASRRMYVTKTPQVDEEVWLNEGLSHIAEELLYYRVSGRAPRQNIDGSQLGTPTALGVFEAHQGGNFDRYREFLRATESSSPMSRNDLLSTRGATWSFLRYLADRTRSSDGDFWRRMVDSRVIGVPNLDAALAGSGVTTITGLRDWSVSVIADDIAGAGASHQQASWQFVSAMSAVGMANPFPLQPRVLFDRVTANILLPGGGTSYMRFAVPQGQQALIQATGAGGGALTAGMRLTIVRLK